MNKTGAKITIASLGAPIAIGRSAEIFPWEEGRVLKLFLKESPAAGGKNTTSREFAAQIFRHVAKKAGRQADRPLRFAHALPAGTLRPPARDGALAPGHIPSKNRHGHAGRPRGEDDRRDRHNRRARAWLAGQKAHGGDGNAETACRRAKVSGRPLPEEMRIPGRARTNLFSLDGYRL